MVCTGKKDLCPVDLENDVSLENARQMAVNSILEEVGVKIEAGKKTELFWVIVSIIASAVLIAISIFGNKKKKRR